MDQDQPLTPQEVADTLRIAKNTVYELIKRGELKGYRVGNKFRVNARDLESYRRAGSGIPGPLPVLPEEHDHKRQGGAVAATARIPVPARAEEASPAEPVPNQGFVLCGQDIMLDILAQKLEMHPAGGRALRSYLGSYNGLYALYQGQVQVATAHLWDQKTNTYNIPFLPHILPGLELVVVHLARRKVGFYVPEGNPFGLADWHDLGRPDLVLANRERGSGMRVLADQKLAELGIGASAVPGYGKVFPTHLAAALAVARKGADYALGTEQAVRQVRGVGFIPLQVERYEMVIPASEMGRPMIRTMLEILGSAEFRQELEGLGGYDLTESGRIVAT